MMTSLEEEERFSLASLLAEVKSIEASTEETSERPLFSCGDDSTSLSLTSRSFQTDADSYDLSGDVPTNSRTNYNHVIDCEPSHKGQTLQSERPVPVPRNFQTPFTVGLRDNHRPTVLTEFDSDRQDAISSANHLRAGSATAMASTPIPHLSFFDSKTGMSATTSYLSLPPRPPPRRQLPAIQPRSIDAERPQSLHNLRTVNLPQLEESSNGSPAPIGESNLDDRMFKLRDYQEEVSEKIIKHWNDIIILPTGTGKTAIAINAIRKRLLDYEKDPDHLPYPKILFLATRVVLVEQQLEEIKRHIPVYWAYKCRKLTGGDITSMDDLETLFTDTQWAVIAATPQTVFNYFLAFNSSTMKRFSLVVFDECHNARGGDAYNRLLFQYMDEKFMCNSRHDLPQLVGLTATVGIGSSKDEMQAGDFIISLCSRFDLQDLPSEAIKCRESVEAIRNPPYEAVEHVEEQREDPFTRYIKEEIMKQIITDVKTKLHNTPTLRRIHFNPAADVMKQGFEQKCVVLESDLSRVHDVRPDNTARDCIISVKLLRVYQQALKWANFALLTDAMSYLKDQLSRPELRGNQFSQQYEADWKFTLQELASKEQHYPNNKLQVLKQQLDMILSTENCQPNELPRIMIFVEYRRLAYMIRDWIRSLGPQYKVERFVSRLVSSDDFGMSSEESKAVMQRFRNGDLNILVATSVLSEGVDIPACNGTIRYLFIKDVIAEVQVPGRMRSWGGRVVAIVDDKLYKQYLDNKRKEKIMEKALQHIRQIPTEKFVKLMEAEQMRLYQERLAVKRKREMGNSKPRNSQINCRQCGLNLGELSDVYRYLEAHYIILDKELLERVELMEGLEHLGSPQDGMTDVGILVCRGTKCHAELGKVITIKISQTSRKLGIWDIEKIRLVASQDNFNKWEMAAKKFVINEIKQEGLRNKLVSGHMLD